MKKYSIPIIWQCYDSYDVEAENLEEAVTLALKRFLSEPDDKYIEDSFEIDGFIDEEYPDETFDINKIIKNL